MDMFGASYGVGHPILGSLAIWQHKGDTLQAFSAKH